MYSRCDDLQQNGLWKFGRKVIYKDADRWQNALPAKGR
jgi:hypothetical protein